MKAELKAGYDKTQEKAVTGGAAVTFKAGEVRIRASMTDATVINCPSLDGLVLAVEKPDSFIFEYNFPKKLKIFDRKTDETSILLPNKDAPKKTKDFTFQFMNSFKVLEKPLNLKYTHSWGEDETTLDGTLVFDSANKLSANHKLGSGGCKLKYTYVHGGLTTLEPSYSYDTKESSFDIAVSRKVYGDDVCKATYQTKSNTKSNNLGLEWSRSSKLGGSFKVGASLRLDDKEYISLSKLTAETSWDFEI